MFEFVNLRFSNRMYEHKLYHCLPAVQFNYLAFRLIRLLKNNFEKKKVQFANEKEVDQNSKLLQSSLVLKLLILDVSIARTFLFYVRLCSKLH